MNTVIQDLIKTLRRSELWLLLGWLEIKQRYTRSVLGPLWITISMAVMVGSIGVVYGSLFKQDMKNYLPMVGCGFVVWGYISGTINDACFSYINNGRYILQTNASFFIYIFQNIWKQLIIFVHNLAIPITLIFIFGADDYANFLLVIPGLIIVTLNLIWISQLVAIYSVRFRDIPQMVSAVIQILFYVTPIMWKPNMLPTNNILLEYNPFVYLVDILKSPLMGDSPKIESWVISVIILVIGWGAMALLSNNKMTKIPTWI